MKKDTKELIYETFVELLSQKPFDKITVKDIVEACDINRNTFYYYYSDIYDLLEEIFKNQLNIIVEAHRNGSPWAMAFLKVANVAYSRKKLINNICASRSYDYLENYMYKALKHIMVEAVQYMAEGMNVPEEDIEFIASFYEYGFVGMLSEWFRTGMREDPLILANRLWLVIDGIKHSLKKSQRRMRMREENDDLS